MLRKSLLLAGCSALAQITVAILYIVVARVAGPTSLGSVVAAVAAGTFLAGLIDFGTNNLWVREVSNGRAPINDLHIKIASKIYITLIIGIIIATLSLWALPETDFYATGILAFTTVTFQALLTPLKLSASGVRLSLAMAAERLFAALFFALLLFLHVPAHVNLVLSLAAGSLAAGVLAYLLAPTTARSSRLIPRPVWPWRDAASHGTGGALLAAQTLDATILHAVAGPVATGIYGAVNRWTQPMGVFATAFATTGLPVVARTASVRKAYGLLRHSWWLLGLGALVCLVIAIGSPVIVQILLGPEYRDSAGVLAILAIATIPALVNQPFYVFLQAMHLERQAAFIVATAVATQLILCATLAYLYAEVGAAASFALAQFMLLSGFTALILKHDHK